MGGPLQNTHPNLIQAIKVVLSLDYIVRFKGLMYHCAPAGHGRNIKRGLSQWIKAGNYNPIWLAIDVNSI